MLVTPEFINVDPGTVAILEAIGGDVAMPQPYKGMEGVYVISHFNFEHFIKLPGGEALVGNQKRWDYEYPEFPDEYHKRIPPDRRHEDETHGYFHCYGVCDSPEQLLELVGDALKADERQFVLSFTHVPKEPGEGGWRWHKWGPYIGTGLITMEYLADEHEFDDGVWVYHIHQVGGELWYSEETKRIRAYVAERDAKEAAERGA